MNRRLDLQIYSGNFPYLEHLVRFRSINYVLHLSV